MAKQISKQLNKKIHKQHVEMVNQVSATSHTSKNSEEGFVPSNGNWGSDIQTTNGRVIINDLIAHVNTARRVNEARGIDYDILQEHIDDTIYELIPTPPPLPNKPPFKGEEPDGQGELVNYLFVANWYQLYDNSGGTHPDININDAGWRDNGHEIPAIYGVNPKYTFYTGDNPLFYIYNPTSHFDPELSKDDLSGDYSLRQRVLPDSIVWKIDGQEVHRGIYLQMFNVKRSDAEKILTVDINNAAGTLSQTVSFRLKDSDEDDHAESFSAEYQGFFAYDPTAHNNRGKARWQEDPRYQPRRVKFQIHWNDYGNGKNVKRKFKKAKPSIKVDGIQMNDKLTNEAGELITIHNGNTVEKDKYGNVFYMDKPPGPYSIEIGTKFNFSKGWKRRRRTFYKNFEGTIDLDSPLNEVIDLGTITVGKTDGKR